MFVLGNDDLRQDAVMQQVFGLMTRLLNKDQQSRRKCLSVRTYKVVPLSQRSGILQWCENTQPLHAFLVHKEKGAHQRYRPNDISHEKARVMMQPISDSKNRGKFTKKQKLALLQEVYKKFSPVMRFFFLENFIGAGKLIQLTRV